jgi:dTDP-4-dehydrorhamnose reductase
VRLFVTGLGGYLGRAIAATASAQGHEVAGTVRARPAPPGARAVNVDVRDEAAVRAALADTRPDAVIHTAYVQHGDEARSVNVDGAAAVARAAHAAGVRLVHVSSDVIFPGDTGRPVREEDPPDPITAYGATKAAAEAAVSAAHPGALLVRTSLIYGGAEPSDHERRALDPDMTFYDDEIRCPVVAGDLAAALVELAARDDVRGPLHVAGADAVSRLEFARLVAAANGRDPALVRGGPHPPGRPGDITLDCSRARALLRTRLRARGARSVTGGWTALAGLLARALAGPAQARLGAVAGALELPQPGHARGPRPVDLGPVQVVALAVVARLGLEVLDALGPRRRHRPRRRASSLSSRAMRSGASRRRSSSTLSSSRTAWRCTASWRPSSSDSTCPRRASRSSRRCFHACSGAPAPPRRSHRPRARPASMRTAACARVPARRAPPASICIPIDPPALTRSRRRVRA